MSYEDDSDRLGQLTTLWPYDGPHSAESVTQAAEAISQLVRYIANATQGEDRYPYMSTVEHVAGSLGMASYRLGQVFDQMKTAVESHARSGDLYDDRDPEARGAGSAAAFLTAEHIDEARNAAQSLGRSLAAIATETNHVGHRTPGGRLHEDNRQ